MVRLNLFLFGVLFGAVAIQASTFKIKVDNGEVVIVKKSSLSVTTITDSGNVAMGDSIILATGHQAVIQLETSSRLICMGPVDLALSGEMISLKIGLDGEGQIFLERKKPYDLGFIEIISKGFVFRPIGTAAAVKTTKSGNPSTAVLEGKMSMQAPNGGILIVEEGNYGAVDPTGTLVLEKLSPNAIESLQRWASGKGSSQMPFLVQAEPQSEEQRSQNAPQTVPVSQPSALNSTDKPSLRPQADAAKPESSSAQTDKNPSDGLPGQGTVSDDEKGTKQDKTRQNKMNQSAGQETAAGGGKPQWEIGAGVVTVDNEQWTRIALGVDVPIWKFGVFFDLELFVDNKGNISDKGWNFKDEPLEAITRKIRYIRLGYEQDPLFIKFGGLSSVTLGYGFLVDRFTNMLHYPDQKLLGLQFYLNDLTSIGLTLQTVLADFKDFKDDGGVLGARLAFKPLKMSPLPIINGISVGATYAVDLNQYAPARKWDIEVPRSLRAYSYLRNLGVDSSEAVDSSRSFTGSDPLSDSLKYGSEVAASKATDQFGLIGGDIGIPLIRSSLVSLDLYGQAGIRDDGKRGWGIGVPGFALKVWRLWASIEYRRIQGQFIPGYFGMYYLDERIIRNYADKSGLSTSRISIKETRIPDDELNGIFGKLGFNIANVLIIDGAYQYMVGKDRDNTDQRFEATVSIGDLLVQKIPKVNKVEVYYYKSEIGSYALAIDPESKKVTYDKFFDETPLMYYGYRLGFEISQGASLIWNVRNGYKVDKNGKMKENNFISVQTAITF